MPTKFPEHDRLDLPKVADEMLAQWEQEGTFEQSLELRKGAEPYVFYEGPPSANGLPGIHHVMARTIKDIFCRYWTQKGKLVDRKAGWDTHGLPIELGVEKELGITKEDIGTKITIEEYNAKCREAVMRYTDVWNDMTRKVGYWLDLDHPYITYKTKYIESVWYQLKQLFDQGLLYKGYSVQPYSPAAGTGLSTHELNQPGTYRSVKDTTIVAMFKVIQDEKSEFLFTPSPPEKGSGDEGTSQRFGEVFLLAWTTTPWTLPSNTALTVGPKMNYVRVRTYDPYTHEPCTVILAKELVGRYFPEKNAEIKLGNYDKSGKNIPFEVDGEWRGSDLEGIRYEQLLPYAQPQDGDAFRVITGDFVTTEEGTGIVHTAPSFGADDQRVAKQHGIGSLTMVDLQGRFVPEMGEFAGRYVKNEYYSSDAPDKSVDVEIAIKLKTEGRAFKVEKYEHNYPHCWRTDKPVLYYPLDSWFVKVTEKKEELIALNKKINWKPASTGRGRFGNWLENLQDWNLSRSRFWGVPLPVWSTEDGSDQICIGSLEQLKDETAKSVKAGVMETDPIAGFTPNDMSDANYDQVDLHRPYVDDIVLVSSKGEPMRRETDLIDVWFDSGSMPYAQWHYPFENKEVFDKKFPADLIAEGVDQTRGWFYTLHAIATLNHGSVAYKNVISNGLVLDKNGQKMSKRLGNAVDPFETMDTYGTDAVRWYMISNAQPWDNLKFDLEGITEVQRKFFRALSNTYGFFALYANIDDFRYTDEEVPMGDRPEMDRWVLSLLNTLIGEVDAAYTDHEPTKAARAIQEFVVDDLSNWYVRLNRRRFWKGEKGTDKIAAFQTLYTCLEIIAMLSAPIAPFYSDRLFRDLNGVSGKRKVPSVHLSNMPVPDQGIIDRELEEQMKLAQQVTSLVLSLRKKGKVRVRQPLQRIMVPALNDQMADRLRRMQDLILSEVNVKGLELIEPSEGKLVKRIKPDFKKLGPRFGKQMKAVTQAVNSLRQDDINTLEVNGRIELSLPEGSVELLAEDVEIMPEDVPGWSVASEGALTVALDLSLNDQLIHEGLARELVSRIQGLRKDSGFEVTDRIELRIKRNGEELLDHAVREFAPHILSETLAVTPPDKVLVDELDLPSEQAHEVDLDGVQRCVIGLSRSVG